MKPAREGGAEASPTVLYCERRRFDLCGSAYKYPALISQIVPTATVRTSTPQGVREAIQAHRPKLLLVRGDNSKLYSSAGDTPYVVIQHDVGTLRGNGSENHERKMLEGAAGVLFNSERMMEYCRERYRMRNLILVPLEPLAKDIVFPAPEKVGRSVVFSGGMRVRSTGFYGYRSYHELFERIISFGWEMHAYGASWSGRNLDSYRDIGVRVHDTLPASAQYAELARYTVGLQAYGGNADEAGYDYAAWAMPNKVFEYRGAGIPTLGVRSEQGYVYDGKWGVWCKDERGLERALERAAAMEIPDEYRYLTIERHAGRVAKWLNGIL